MSPDPQKMSGSVSVWVDSVEPPSFPTLTKDEESEVCVVGAGIAGLTTAYLLGRAGVSVIVIDDGAIGSGETARTTAHLVTALDDRYFELERLHGERGAWLAAQSHAAAIDQIERIVLEERIECDFERLSGYLFAPPEDVAGNLEKELEAARRAGLIDLNMTSRAPISAFDTGPAIEFPRQAQFHPLKYLYALSKAIVRDGGRIFVDTHADKIEGGAPALVETIDQHVIRSDAVVVATNSPVNDLIAIHTKQSAYRTYVIAALVPAESVTRALYWDTQSPYHYIRLASYSRTEDLLLVGGEDHKTGQADDAAARYLRLDFWARSRFPMIDSIKYRWSGQVLEPVDGLAFIGRNPMDKENVFVATGDSGNGMTHGTIAGILLTDLIQGRKNEWSTLYDPSRKTLRAFGKFVREAANSAAQYGDWVTRGKVDDETLVTPGMGAVVRRGLEKFAIYCDDDGRLYECSAVCPHLGGIVVWNSSEKTWDCPCHGSRFDRFGKVIDGPANQDLAPKVGPPLKLVVN